jgi:hypothetical protein
MVVGATLSGKSALLRTLGKALTSMARKDLDNPAAAMSARPTGAALQATSRAEGGPEAAPSGAGAGEGEGEGALEAKVVRVKTLNPKALPSSALYGVHDENTHEWTDGVLANAIRAFATDIADELKWIVCGAFQCFYV